MFLKLIKGKIFALSPKPRPIWGLYHRDGLVSVFTVCLLLRGLLLVAGEKSSVLSLSRSRLSFHGSLYCSELTLVALNGSTCAREIAADAWERELGSCSLKRLQM